MFEIHRRKMKSAVLAGLCFTLICAAPAHAMTVVPPPPSGSSQSPEAGAGAAPGTNTPQGGGQGGFSGPGVSEGPGLSGGNENVLTTETGIPEIKAEGGALLDVSTGKFLYQKNGDTRYYPASITKLMTALLVAERCNADDIVTFSKTATTNLESGSVTLNMAEGDQLTVNQCLYGLLLKSANEVANALAEHTSGSVAGFADLMNQRAAQIGCTGTHFVNPNGLNNSNHYTTPKDMALIAGEAFRNETVSKVASTLSYQIPATKKAGARTITMGHKMLYPGDARYYPGILGGKTGYTSLAGNTLVTCVEKNGVRLIAVVMKSKSTQYDDTKVLLDYGFKNRETILQGGASNTAKWLKDGEKWKLEKPDGTKAVSQWLNVDGEDYWFGPDEYMATGWRKFQNGAWYYFRSSGAMAKNYWAQNSGKWFYLGSDGVMVTNTTTPDGYRVDENGAWIQ